MSLHMLDRVRAEERIRTHFGGDVSRLVDLTRFASTIDGVEAYRRFLEGTDRLPGAEVVSMRDRIAEPGPRGHRDLKVYVRLESSGYISTFRFVPREILEAQHNSLGYEAELARLDARAQAGSQGAAAIVLDHFLCQEPDGRTLLLGFPDFAAAREYARRRTRDSLETLREEGQSVDELRTRWLLLGEDVLAINLENEAEYHHADMDLDRFLEAPADEDKRDWMSAGETHRLVARPLVEHAPG